MNLVASDLHLFVVSAVVKEVKTFSLFSSIELCKGLLTSFCNLIRCQRCSIKNLCKISEVERFVILFERCSFLDRTGEMWCPSQGIHGGTTYSDKVPGQDQPSLSLLQTQGLLEFNLGSGRKNKLWPSSCV